MPRRGAREQQIRDVRADDQQHEHDDHAQDRDGAGIGRVDVIDAAASRIDAQTRHLRPVAVPGIGSHLRCHRREIRIEPGSRGLLKDRLEIRLHLRRGHTRFQTAHHLKPPVRRPLEQRNVRLAGSSRGIRELRHERERHRDVRAFAHCLLDVDQIGRDDADDRHRRAVQAHRLANHARVASEPRAPVARADHRNRRRGRLVVFGHDRPAGIRGQPEHAIVVARRHERAGNLRLTIDDNAHPVDDWGAGEQILHRSIVGNELLEHRIGKRAAKRKTGRVGAREAVIARVRRHVVAACPLQPDETVGISDRELPQKQAVDRAEERRVRADAERERDDHNGGPAFVARQRPSAVPEIAKHAHLSCVARLSTRRPSWCQQ